MTALYIGVGVIIVALIILLVLYFRNPRRARAAAAADAGGAPGSDEISVLIHEAEAKLWAAKLAQGKRVGNLPIYVLMGEPGTTKTSVMLHCGLEPELLAGQVYQGGNVMPTRSANLWFSQRAIFAEAGGQLLADAGKWRTFVKKLQPRSSVVGKGEQASRAAVVCFDCENFTKPGSADITATSARNLRARLGEISQALGINLPVYVLFTKTDRLPYFTEFVRNLNDEEATRAMGITLPMLIQRAEGVYAEEETGRLTGNFEQLFHALADARPVFLGREGDVTQLTPVYEFPREFRKIRPAVVQFLVDLCRPSQLTVGPFLRGFYFTGVRPLAINDAAPVAAAAPQAQGFGAVSGATDILRGMQAQQAQQAAAPPVLAARKVPQWLFLSSLFNEVLLADRAAMGASGASTKTNSTRRILLIVAASLSFLLTVGFTFSFVNNHEIETQVRDVARAIPVGESTSADLASPGPLQKLDVLRQTLGALARYNRDGPPFLYGWFLYTGEDVYRKARPVYCSGFRQLLLRQTQEYMVPYLQTLQISNAEYGPAYDALRSYLIITSHPEKSDEDLTPALIRFWTDGGRRTVDPERLALAQQQFEFYRQDLLVDQPCTATGDAETVVRARRYLNGLGSTQRVYQQMLTTANKKFPRVNFNYTFKGSERYVVDPYWVAGAFTKDGWMSMINAIAHAGDYVKGEAWVLGDEGARGLDLGKLSADIKSLYVADFINEWRNYLKQAKVVAYKDLTDAGKKLAELSGSQSPLLELFMLASQNTAVDEAAVKSVFQPVQLIVPPDAPRPIGGANQQYMEALGQLQAAVESVKEPTGMNDDGGRQIQSFALAAINSKKKLAQQFNPDPQGHANEEVERLLGEPITSVRVPPPVDLVALNAAGAGLCKAMYPLQNKYPFNPKPTAEKATLEEVNQFFKPGEGMIWARVETSLKTAIAMQGATYVAKPGPGFTVNPKFVDFLNRAAAFANKAYANNSAGPRFAYSVRLVPSPDLENAALTIDGTNFTFPGAGGPAQEFTWPGTGHNVTLSVKMKGGNLHSLPDYADLWAVFEFVTEADYQSDGNPTRVRRDLGSGNPKRITKDPVTGKDVTVSFDFIADPPVFQKGYFARLSCVSNVANPTK